MNRKLFLYSTRDVMQLSRRPRKTAVQAKLETSVDNEWGENVKRKTMEQNKTSSKKIISRHTLSYSTSWRKQWAIPGLFLYFIIMWFGCYEQCGPFVLCCFVLSFYFGWQWKRNSSACCQSIDSVCFLFSSLRRQASFAGWDEENELTSRRSIRAMFCFVLLVFELNAQPSCWTVTLLTTTRLVTLLTIDVKALQSLEQRRATNGVIKSSLFENLVKVQHKIALNCRHRHCWDWWASAKNWRTSSGRGFRWTLSDRLTLLSRKSDGAFVAVAASFACGRAHVWHVEVVAVAFGTRVSTDVECLVNAAWCCANFLVDAIAGGVSYEAFFAGASWWSWCKCWARLALWITACWLARILVADVFFICRANPDWTFICLCAHAIVSDVAWFANASLKANFWAGQVARIGILASILASSTTLWENFVITTELWTRHQLNAVIVVVLHKAWFAEAALHACWIFAISKWNFASCVPAAWAACHPLLVFTRASCC